MKSVKVRLGSRGYSIHIAKGVISKIPSLVRLKTPDTPVFVVTNKKINRLHGKRLKAALRKISGNTLFYEIPDSEKAKSFPVYIKAIRRLARFSRKKKPLVVAFGGGVVGDLAGFIASSYRRGVPYIQIPTTLLAQVDSAIGGKVAIDIKEAKNIVGGFYQPTMVLADLGFLATLSAGEVRNGLAEVVKYGIIKDRGLFFFLEKNVKKALKKDAGCMEHIVFKCCRIKAGIVERDERDTRDVRAILNFGHTIGHAIEAAGHYSKGPRHGEAVAIGMNAACYIALRLGMIKKESANRICALVTKVVPRRRLKAVRTGSILHALSYDKKFVRGKNRFILPERIGRVRVVEGIERDLIKKAIQKNI